MVGDTWYADTWYVIGVPDRTCLEGSSTADCALRFTLAASFGAQPPSASRRCAPLWQQGQGEAEMFEAEILEEVREEADKLQRQRIADGR